MELVDIEDLKSSASNSVWVRFPPRAQVETFCWSGGIGIRASLRNWSRKGWEFESPLQHKKILTGFGHENLVRTLWSQIIFSPSRENFRDPASAVSLASETCLRLAQVR